MQSGDGFFTKKENNFLTPGVKKHDIAVGCQNNEDRIIKCTNFACSCVSSSNKTQYLPLYAKFANTLGAVTRDHSNVVDLFDIYHRLVLREVRCSSTQ